MYTQPFGINQMQLFLLSSSITSAFTISRHYPHAIVKSNNNGKCSVWPKHFDFDYEKKMLLCQCMCVCVSIYASI